MEPNEIEHIEKNLRRLIEVTHVTTTLKAGLVSLGLISTEEEQKLCAIGANIGPIVEARELYRIIQTRNGGYKAIVQLLAIERQTGALNILVPNESVWQKPFNKGSIYAEEFLKLQVEARQHDEVTCLAEVFPVLTEHEVHDILETPEAQREFLNLRHTGPVLRISGDIPRKNQLHIERSVTNRFTLSPTVLSLESSDVLVFYAEKSIDLLPYKQKFATRSAKSQIEDQKITSKHIFIEELDEWNELVQISTEPMHLIQVEVNKLVLLRSTRGSQALSKHRLQYLDAYVTESELVGKLSLNKEARCICICDIPGMGKTWFVSSIARRLHEISSQSVFIVSIPTVSSYLKGQIGIGQESNLKLLLDFVCDSVLTSRLLFKCITRFAHKICFFLDGFDEIDSAELTTTTTFLARLIKETENVRICITSRQNMQQDLEKTFHVIAYEILPFNRNDQVQALINHWADEHRDHRGIDVYKLKELAEQILKNCETFENSFGGDIMGVPLQCYMLAKVESSLAKRYSSSSKPSSHSISGIVKSISDLYQRYLENGIKDIYSGVYNQDKDRRTRVMLQFHTLKAFELIFPKAPSEILGTFKILEEPINRDVLKLGVLIKTNRSSNEGSEYSFIHRTFAEYLVAKYFVKYFVDGSQSGQRQHNLVVEFFFSDVLKLYEPYSISSIYNIEYFVHPGVLRFFDSLLPVTAVISPYDFTFSDSAFLNLEDRLNEIVDDMGRDISNQMLGNPTAVEDMERIVAFILIDLYTALEYLLARGLNTVFTFLTKMINLLPTLHTIWIGGRSRNNIFTITYAENDRPTLTISPLRVINMLDHLARKGKVFAAEEFFRLFQFQDGNMLGNFCSQIDPKHSQVLKAVQVNNSEMFTFFLGKTKFSANDIMYDIVISPDYPNINVRYQRQMTSIVFEKRTTILSEFLSKYEKSHNIEDLKSYLYQNLPVVASTQMLEHLCLKHNFYFTEVLFLQKVKHIEHILCEGSDKEVWDIIFLFFGNHFLRSAKKTISLVDNALAEANSNLTHFTASNWSSPEKFLQSIDIKQAKLAFSLLRFPVQPPCFRWLTETFTLKLLLALGENYTETNQLQMGLLHYAVCYNKPKWIQSLLSKGFDINLKDKLGHTPLFYIGGPEILTLTKFLIKHKADMYAVNLRKQNIVHILASGQQVGAVAPDHFQNWCLFMLESGYQNLWMHRDDEGTAPIHLMNMRCTAVKEVIAKLLTAN